MPLSPDDIIDLNDFAVTLAVAQNLVDETLRQRDEMIRDLMTAGACSYSQMSREAGITRARIYQICAD